jgi:hypothetical protein
MLLLNCKFFFEAIFRILFFDELIKDLMKKRGVFVPGLPQPSISEFFN